MRLRLGLTGAGVAALVLPLPSGLVDRVFSRTAYPPIQGALTTLTNQVSFALLDPALVVLLILVLGRVGLAAFTRGSRSRWQRLGGAALDLSALAGVLLLAFVCLWGLNYRRDSLASGLAFESSRVTPGALRSLVRDAIEELNAAYPRAYRSPWPDPPAVPAGLRNGLDKALEYLGEDRRVVTGRPKTTWLGWYFRQAAIDGMTDPFFLEILLNPDLLPFERPFVVAHEWAHLAGRAHEAEASFVGWLACLHGDAQSVYSGWLFLLIQMLSGLPPGEAAEAQLALASGPRADLRQVGERLARASPRVRAAAWATYDRYLKANRVPAGVASYNEVTRLVLGTAFEPGWIPRRREERRTE